MLCSIALGQVAEATVRRLARTLPSATWAKGHAVGAAAASGNDQRQTSAAILTDSESRRGVPFSLSSNGSAAFRAGTPSGCSSPAQHCNHASSPQPAPSTLTPSTTHNSHTNTQSHTWPAARGFASAASAAPEPSSSPSSLTHSLHGGDPYDTPLNAHASTPLRRSPSARLRARLSALLPGRTSESTDVRSQHGKDESYHEPIPPDLVVRATHAWIELSLTWSIIIKPFQVSLFHLEYGRTAQIQRPVPSRGAQGLLIC